MARALGAKVMTSSSNVSTANRIAPFAKKLVISDSESSLKDCVEKYHLGEVVPNDDVEALSNSIRTLLTSNTGSLVKNWSEYIADSSWDLHVSIAVEQYKKILNVL